jgi:hypothetical protein
MGKIKILFTLDEKKGALINNDVITTIMIAMTISSADV